MTCTLIGLYDMLPFVAVPLIANDILFYGSVLFDSYAAWILYCCMSLHVTTLEHERGASVL